MSGTPRVSVCVPTFNGGRWLAECLASAVTQTERDLEVVVADDGSEDDTVAIARSVAASDPRLRVVAADRRLGLVGNWNRCVAMARGTWVKLLFQDDALAPECVARMCAAGERTGASMVVCERRIEVEPGADPAVAEYLAGLPRLDEVFGTGELVSASEFGNALAAHPAVNFVGEPAAVLLRREVFAAHGAFCPQLIQLCDLEYWARVGSMVGCARVRDTLATFRVHGLSASATQRASRQFRKEVLDPLVLLHEFAFAPGYQALRQVAAARRPPVDFALLASSQLNRAVAEARRYPLHRPALEEVLTAHPKLTRPAWRLWQGLRKLLSSRGRG